MRIHIAYVVVGVIRLPRRSNRPPKAILSTAAVFGFGIWYGGDVRIEKKLGGTTKGDYILVLLAREDVLPHASQLE